MKQKEKIALVVSLQFRPAHVSHLIASYKQLEELGYTAYLYIHKSFVDYLPQKDHLRYCTSLNSFGSISLAIFWFPSMRNILAMSKLRFSYGAQLLYVYHEPMEKISAYRRGGGSSGNNYWWIVKHFLKTIVSDVFILLSHQILLPSRKAMALYENGHSRFFCEKYAYFPLIYDDEQTENEMCRRYFSYIGTIHADHAFNEYIDYICYTFQNNIIPENLSYLVATSSVMERTDVVNQMVDTGKLVIQEGKPMTNEEINYYYGISYCVWNAYNRTTQSGVLAKAFMFGTPAIVMKKNLSEFIEDGRETIAIESNQDYSEISKSVETIISRFDYFSKNARKAFESSFFYRNYNERLQDIIRKL